MIDLSTPNEWQHICPDTGLIMPWYTKPALDEIVTWDLKEKVVFEYGCGASSLWWAAKCGKLYGVEANYEYFLKLSEYGMYPHIAHYETEYEYIGAPKEWGKIFDIIIIDGDYRDACVPVALEWLNPGGALIFDNWMQPSVEVQSEETQQLLLSLPHKIYRQENHQDWQIGIFMKMDYPLSDPRSWADTNYWISKIANLATH